MSIREWERMNRSYAIRLSWNEIEMIRAWAEAKKENENVSRVTRSEAVREMIKVAHNELTAGRIY